MSLGPALPENQWALAVSIFVGTFVYEDGATLLAATLSAAGRLDPVLGAMASILGIWIGDIGLYAMGSSFRRYTARCSRFQQFLKAESLEKAKAWFARHGSLALVMSRAIPGSRLPLYLAAGALQHPLRKFVRITGICAAIWVSMIFGIWRFTPGLPSGSGSWLRWLLIGIVLGMPWVLGKSLGLTATRGETTEGARQRSMLKVCAL